MRCYRRREPDATRIVHRLRPRALAGTALRLAPWALVPLVAGTWLALEVGRGREGGAAKKQEKDYWRKNLATYRDARSPRPPPGRAATSTCSRSGRATTPAGRSTWSTTPRSRSAQVLLTGGPHWEKLAWTRDGEPYQPDDRAHLYVFTPAGGVLAPGQSMTIGFEHEGTFPRGHQQAEGGFAGVHPALGRGPDELPAQRGARARLPGFGRDRRREPAGLQGVSRRLLRGPDRLVPRLRARRSRRGSRITGPGRFTLNSVGTKTADDVKDGRRTVVWESEHPVSFFNVVAGPMGRRAGRGDGRVLSPRPSLQHRRDAPGARRGPPLLLRVVLPLPLARAQAERVPEPGELRPGVPDQHHVLRGHRLPDQEHARRSTRPFEITAHEAAHQWWGNILVPGKGPGGNVLSEGTSHFSTILLVEQV